MLDLDFGKYSGFIWGAYGVTALVFVLMIISSLRFSGYWRRRAEDLKAQEDHRS